MKRPPPDADTPIRGLLDARARGDKEAAAALLPLVYEELRALARARMAALPEGQTLCATALVHEAYIRLVGDGDPGWDHRGHFFAAAAQAMRDIIVEQHRRKRTAKRGGDRDRIDFARIEAIADGPTDDILIVHETLLELEKECPKKSQLINLRYFAGLGVEETAAILGVSTRTVDREWRYVRAWLRRRLGPE